MRTRMLFCASAIALVAASCSQPEPHVLSEAPRATTATDLTSVTETTEREPEPGRFIARCATEADGGTPGMTMFTDGSQGITDHCLSRYYMGVQPAPGALYVPDQDAGTYAPSRSTEDEPTPTYQWTPAQPRTDAGPDNGAIDDDRDQNLDLIETDGDGTGDGTEENPDSTEPGSEVTSPEETPTTTTPDEPGETTEPGETGETTTPGDTDPTDPTETTTPGSSEPTPTAVPTVTEPEDTSSPEAPPETAVTSTVPSRPQPEANQQASARRAPSAGAQQSNPEGSAGSGDSASAPGSLGSAGSHHGQRPPFPFGSLHFTPPTAVQPVPAPAN